MHKNHGEFDVNGEFDAFGETFVNHMVYITNNAGMKRVKQHFSVGAAAVGKVLENEVQVLLKFVSSQQ